MKNSKLTLLVACAWALAGCLDVEDAEIAEPVDELGEITSEATVNSRWCVYAPYQGYASAQRLEDGYAAERCWVMGNSNWDTRLSHGHPVHYKCSGNSSYYWNVRSLWNGTYYTVRKDALRPC